MQDIIEIKDNSILKIFVSDEDENGYDLLKMSNFLEIFMNNISEEVNVSGKWGVVEDYQNLLGQISEAIKLGFDLSQMDMLVADMSHFSKEITDGLKSGIYHIGESKEVAGRLRPAVLDEKEKLVKFVTLKKALNPSEILGDISQLAIQSSLSSIASQIESVSMTVKGISDFVRRQQLSDKFLYARDRVKRAVEDKQNCLTYLREADKYLMEGLTSLYSDVNEEVKQLNKLSGTFRSLDTADEILVHINEDMQMIPRYVGMRVYLLNYCADEAGVLRIIDEFRSQLDGLSKKKSDEDEYTPLEVIHKYYPYDKKNLDFWLEKPKQMANVLRTFEKVQSKRQNDIYLLDVDQEVLVSD